MQQSLLLISSKGNETHGRRCCALVTRLDHLRVEEAAPNTSSRGILLVVVGVADGPRSGSTHWRRSWKHAASLKRKLKASLNLAPVVNFVDGCCRPYRHGNQLVVRRWLDTSTWGRPPKGCCRCRLSGSPDCQLTRLTSSWPLKVTKSIAPRRRHRTPEARERND